MGLRIIGGEWGGRRLLPPLGMRVRPTGARARESLFSALESRMELAGLRVLDGFAGSGALGLEALSRGAGQAVFVEWDKRAVGLLRENLHRLGVSAPRGVVVRARLEAWLGRAGEAHPAGAGPLQELPQAAGTSLEQEAPGEAACAAGGKNSPPPLRQRGAAAESRSPGAVAGQATFPLDAFDLVLLDPPYAHNPQHALQLLCTCGWLAPAGWVALETGRQARFTAPTLLESVRTKRYGEALLTLLRYKDSPHE